MTARQVLDTRSSLGIEHLVDLLVGVVRRVADAERLPELPRNYHCRIASVADTRQFAVWLSDRIAAGTSFGDRRQAWLAAVGEAVERYCGNNIPEDLPLASADELRRRGEAVADLTDLPRFSAEQLNAPGFPYRDPAPGEPIRWVAGHDPDGRRWWLPGSWVYLNWHQGSRRDDPRTNHLHYAGIATGTGFDDAVDRALAECLERDSVVAWWTLGLPATPIRPESLPGFGHEWAGCPLQVRLVSLPSDFGMPVIGALIWDRHRRIPAAGFSAGSSPRRAGWKAIQEALQVWIASRGLLDADGASYRALRAGIFAPRCYLPHREDRRYLDDAGEDFSRIVDLAAQTQVWLDERLHPLLTRFDGTGAAIDIDDVPPGDLATARDRLEESGHREIRVDLTTADVAETGLRVARVIVTGLLVNSPAAFPYLATPRLARIARRHRRPPPSPASVTLAPPPHN